MNLYIRFIREQYFKQLLYRNKQPTKITELTALRAGTYRCMGISDLYIHYIRYAKTKTHYFSVYFPLQSDFDNNECAFWFLQTLKSRYNMHPVVQLWICLPCHTHVKCSSILFYRLCMTIKTSFQLWLAAFQLKYHTLFNSDWFIFSFHV